ncbi:MAG TPA: MipA/OmpV family protein [Allosphingosinicella sp.]|nr:MipA/OmpV family protein [Allosphingosinicella sp.]
MSGIAFGSAFAAALLCLPLPARARDPDRNDRGWLVTLGLTANAAPEFPGAGKLQLAPIPSIDLRRVGDPLPFEPPDQSVGVGLLGRRDGFDFGPAAQIRLKREQEDVGAPVGEVGFTVEAGLFVQAWPIPNLRLRAEGRKGIGGHDGWLSDLSADLVLRDSGRTVFSVGPRLRLADGDFVRTYFGLSPAASARAGIPAYRPGGGLYSVGALASIVHQLSPIWGVTASAGCDRLVRGAAASPIVRRFGSPNQLSVSLGLTYTFAVHRHRP